MRTFVLGLIAISLSSFAITPHDVQDAPRGTSSAASATPAASSADLREAIGRLTVAEERYYADHGTYTTDIAALRLWKPSAVWFRVFHAGGGSWIGEARTLNEPARSCVAFVGELTDFPSVQATAATQLSPTEEGDPVCDPE